LNPSIFRRVVHLAWPVLVGQMAVVGSGVIDTVMAGRLSALDLAAVGVGAAIYITVLAVAGTLLLRHPEPFIALAQLTPAMEEKVRAYLAAVSWGIAPGLAFRIFYGFMSGIGRPRAIMVFNLIGLAAKVPLNAFYMYELGMGATGCGASTATISWLSAILAWSWCARQADCGEYGVLSRLTFPKPRAMLELARLGLPIGLTLLVDVTAFTFMALFIARLGPTMSAAHQVAANLTILVFMIPLSIGHATLVLAGHALGAGDPVTARHTGLVGIAFGLAVSAVVATGLWLGAGRIAALYTPDAEVRAVATGLIAIIAAYHLVDALQTVVVNVLRGYKRTVVPMVIYVVSLWGIGLGGGYLMGLTDLVGTARGAAGFWIAATASLLAAGLLVLAYFLRVSRTAMVHKAVMQ